MFCWPDESAHDETEVQCNNGEDRVSTQQGTALFRKRFDRYLTRDRGSILDERHTTAVFSIIEKAIRSVDDFAMVHLESTV